MAKIVVYLADPERNALHELAEREMRAPRAQAALIIRQELTRLGMLPAQTSSTDMKHKEGQPEVQP